MRHQTFSLPVPSQTPTRRARHSHNGLCLPGFSETARRSQCHRALRVYVARPASSEFRLDLEPHPAVSGSARQTLPGARKGPRLACHQHLRIPQCAGLTPWPTHNRTAETSQYNLRRTPASFLGLRGPYHRTTWSVLWDHEAVAHLLDKTQVTSERRNLTSARQAALSGPPKPIG